MAILEPRFRSLTPMLRPRLCQDDRACELICPEVAIVVIDVSATKRRWQLDLKRCTGCALCIAACPERALGARPEADRSLDDGLATWTMTAWRPE